MIASNPSAPPSKRGERLRFARDLAAGVAVLGLFLWLLCSPRELEPGLTLTRGIGGPEVHRYQARLAAGDFLHVTVDQSVGEEKMDARLLLLGPDGKEIAHADALEGDRWQEELAAVAEAPGLYLLKVSWSGSGPRAPYQLKVKALRPASPQDRIRATALRLYQSAADLTLAAGTEDQQIARRQEALRLWRRLGDREREAIELYQIGAVQLALRRHEEATASFRGSAAAWMEVGNGDEQARALYEVGKVDIREGRYAPARQNVQRGLALTEQPAIRMLLLFIRGTLHIDQGDPGRALPDLQEALRLTRLVHDSREEANVLHELGFAYRRLERWDDAIGHFSRAQEIARAIGDLRIEMSAHNSLGGIYKDLGDWEQSIQHYEKALGLVRKLDWPGAEATILNNLALAYHRSLRIRRALELFQQALALKQLDPETEATALNNMAFVQLELGLPQEALELCDQALELAAGNQDTEAAILEAQAIAFLKLGEHALARQTLARALALSERRNDRFRQASLTVVQGKLARAEGDLDTAVLHARQAVELIESFRTGVEDETLRATFLASKRDPYDFYVDTLVELHEKRPGEGFDADSLRINEMSRARSLLDLLNRAARLEKAGKTYERYSPLTLAEIQSQVLGPGTLLLEYALGERRSYLWAVTPTSLHVFLLPPKRVIEERARSFYGQFLVHTRENADEAAVEQADARATRLAAQLSRIILEPAERAGLLRKESKILVVSDGALQYIPFSALPLPSSLAAGQRKVLMVERHEIVHLPSASVLAFLRRDLDHREPPTRALALIADPVFEPDDSRFHTVFLSRILAPRGRARRQGHEDQAYSRLYWSKEEADRILKLVDRSQVFEARGFDASVATVTRQPLDQYRRLHFATHGDIDSSRPERSSLVLSLYNRDGERQNGHLRLTDVYNLRLNADLVVLSACETALGPEIRGEGLIGLTRGFMYAGSRRVLASLWSVDDRVTAELMERLYRGMLKEGKSPAAALRQAQIDMLRDEDWKSPYYWAGFSLQGEWR